MQACQPVPPKPLVVVPPPKDEHRIVADFINQLIDDRAPNIPLYKRTLIITSIDRVGTEVFGNYEHVMQFATVIAIESGFNEKAKSKAGAVGLTQVMPQYAVGFMQSCGVTDFKKEDLDILELNIRAGACAFKQLLAVHHNNLAAALVAYNAGSNSTSFKALTQGVSIGNLEAANYPAKYMYLKEKVVNKQNRRKE